MIPCVIRFHSSSVLSYILEDIMPGPQLLRYSRLRYVILSILLYTLTYAY